MEVLSNIFLILPHRRLKLLNALSLYLDWNEKINVISRKDIDNLYINHILSRPSCDRVAPKILFWIALYGSTPAIMFPQCQFHLIDSIGKKISVVNGVIEHLNWKMRMVSIFVQEVKNQYDLLYEGASCLMSFINDQYTIHAK